MKTSIYIITLGITAICASACNNKEQRVDQAKENVRDAQENLDQAKIDLQRAQDEYRNETSAKFTENQKDIDELQLRVNNSKEKVDQEYKEKVNRLDQQNKELQGRLRDYNDTDTRDKWDQFKQDFERDMDTLRTSLKDLVHGNKKK
ncbi:MAG: hypothetical protein ACJ77K_09160 [Bacteroidia bacterium]